MLTKITCSITILLILILCILEVKSDACQYADIRHVIDEYGRLVRDPNFLTQIGLREDANLAPPEAIVQQERALLVELGDTIDRNRRRVVNAEQQYGHDPLIREYQIRDRIEQNRLQEELNAFEDLIRARAAQGQPTTEAQRAENRRAAFQHLRSLNNHLELRLARYERVQRQVERTLVNDYLTLLNEYQKYERMTRRKEPSAPSQQAQCQRSKQYRLFDKLELDMRNKLRDLKDAHEQRQPINEEHDRKVSIIRCLWDQLNKVAEEIDERRELEKQCAQS